MGGIVGGHSLRFLYYYSFRLSVSVSVSVSCSDPVCVQYVTSSSSFLGLRFRSGSCSGFGSGLALGLDSGLGSGVVHLSKHCDGAHRVGIRDCLLRSVLYLPC